MSAEGVRRPEIDGLRALAVVAVVLFHAHVPGFDGGFTGVDVFFVISGFLITRLLVLEHARDGRIRLASFWARRFRRILPTLVVTLIATGIVGTVVLTPWERADLFESTRAAAASIANFHFWNLDGGYFASTTAEQPLLHTWSLGVEEQFYLVWPISVLIAVRCGGRRALGAWIGFVAVTSFALAWIVGASSPAAAFYLPHARVWELAIGAVVALLASEPRTVDARVSATLGSLALLGIVGSALFVREGSNFPAPVALLPVLCTAVLIAITSSTTPIGRILSRRGLVAIGRWSYAWYLFHWPAIVMCRAVLGRTSIAWELAMSALALALAALNWRLIETRFAAGSRVSTWPRRRVLALGLGSSLVLVAASTVAASSDRVDERISADEVLATIAPSTIAAPGPSTPAPTSDTPGGFDWSSSEGLDILAESRTQVVWPCVNFEFNLPFSDDCAALDGKTSIVAIGDSHVGSAAPALAQIASDRGLGLRLVGQPQCPLADVDTFLDGEIYGGCREWANDVVEDLVKNRKKVAAVVWVVRSDYYFPGQSIAQRVTIGEASIGIDGVMKSAALAGDIWRDGVRALVSKLSDAGLPVILVHNWPEFREWPSDCLARHPADDCAIERREFESYRSASFQAESEAVAGLNGVIAIDPLEALCDESQCPVADASTVWYRDDNHLTPSGSRRLVPILASALDALITT